MEKLGALLKSLFTAYVLTGIMLLVLAFVMLKIGPGNEMLHMGIVFSYIFSAFVGGFIMGKKMKVKKFLWGVLLGSSYFAVIFLVSALLNQSIPEQGMTMLTVFAMCGLGGMLGGMLS